MIVPIIHGQYILIININNNYLIILNIRNYKNYSKFLTAGDCSPLNEIPGRARRRRRRKLLQTDLVGAYLIGTYLIGTNLSVI